MLSDSERERFEVITSNLSRGPRTNRLNRHAGRRFKRAKNPDVTRVGPIAWAEARFDERLRQLRNART